MSTGGFSKARLGLMREVMARHVERGEVPGVVALLTRRAWTSPVPLEVCRDFWTLAYQAIDD